MTVNPVLLEIPDPRTKLPNVELKKLTTNSLRNHPVHSPFFPQNLLQLNPSGLMFAQRPAAVPLLPFFLSILCFVAVQVLNSVVFCTRTILIIFIEAVLATLPTTFWYSFLSLTGSSWTKWTSMSFPAESVRWVTQLSGRAIPIKKRQGN